MKSIYLCGGIQGLSDEDCCGWRDQVTEQLKHKYRLFNPMVRDYRGKKVTLNDLLSIVDGDLGDIDQSDFLLVRAVKPSWGTCMEVYHAYTTDKVVVVWGAPEPVSPWLLYHSHFQFTTLEEAVRFLAELPADYLDQLCGEENA